MNKVILTKIEGVENAYFSISAHFVDEIGRDKVLKINTVLVYMDNENSMVEWEPTYGPITLIEKCFKDWKDTGLSIVAKKHWYFEWCKGYANWTQCAVDDRGLKDAFVNGEYQYVFSVLKEYSQ